MLMVLINDGHLLHVDYEVASDVVQQAHVF